MTWSISGMIDSAVFFSLFQITVHVIELCLADCLPVSHHRLSHPAPCGGLLLPKTTGADSPIRLVLSKFNYAVNGSLI